MFSRRGSFIFCFGQFHCFPQVGWSADFPRGRTDALRDTTCSPKIYQNSHFHFLSFSFLMLSFPLSSQYSLYFTFLYLSKSFNQIGKTKNGTSEGNFLLWNFSLSLIFLSSLWKQRQTWPERLAGITFAVWEVEIAANPLRSSSNSWFCPKLVSYNFWKNQCLQNWLAQTTFNFVVFKTLWFDQYFSQVRWIEKDFPDWIVFLENRNELNTLRKANSILLATAGE